MPAQGRKMLGFLRGSKHRRGSKASKEDQVVSSEESRVQEDLSEPEPEPDVSSHGSQEDTYFSPEEPVDSADSNPSLNHKPTTATLGETFSSGGMQDIIEYHDSHDESVEVQNSEFLYSEAPEYDNSYAYPAPEHQIQQRGSNGYTEFVNGTQEEDTDTLDYTTTAHDLPYNCEGEDPSDTMAAHHIRSREYESLIGGLENTEWEDTSLGYETCERTLNTNLEGIGFLPDASVADSRTIQAYGVPDVTSHTRLTGHGLSAHTRLTANTGFSHHSAQASQMMVEPQYFYEGDDYDEYQESYGTDGMQYDDEGNLMSNSYPEGDGQFVDDYNTVANSTIATEGIETTMSQPIIATDLLPLQFDDDDDSGDSYESEESNSSWDDEETRDVSLLDEGDTVAEGEDADDLDDDSDSESDSDDESENNGIRQPRPRPKSMMQIINDLKHCALKGGANASSDDCDDSDDDSDGEVPDVAQISTGATSVTSMTQSFDESGKPADQKKTNRTRPKQKNDRNLDNLFNKVSALGHELLLGDDSGPKKKGRKSLRRKEHDPASKIVDSLRDIFNCGHPKHY